MLFFNTAGPVNCEDHYCLNPLSRFDLEEILMLIAQKKYFVLHAPRQTGKTTCLLALMKYLNALGDYECLYINVESAQAMSENVVESIRIVLGEMASRARTSLNDSFMEKNWLNILEERKSLALNEILTRWSARNNKPQILLVDEIDSLIGDTLISVLRQFRAGYDKRPNSFPQSIILCGIRDFRDYRIHSNLERSIITGGSAFNIKAESLRLGDFSKNEMIELYQKHSDHTGQIFSSEAIETAWELTNGQP